MGRMKVEHYVVGPVQTNCYFAVNEETKETLVIDPGASPRGLAKKLRESGCRPVAILLTHGHFDHADGAEELAREFGIPVYAHEAEKDLLEDPQKNAGFMVGSAKAYHADVYVRDEQELDLAGLHMRVLYTPGHTIGGCCYYFPYEDIVFCGDTLFQMSVGRTDLPTGNGAEMIRSIKNKLMVLPERTTVYPGHGDMTDIETERMYNPYL